MSSFLVVHPRQPAFDNASYLLLLLFSYISWQKIPKSIPILVMKTKSSTVQSKPRDAGVAKDDRTTQARSINHVWNKSVSPKGDIGMTTSPCISQKIVIRVNTLLLEQWTMCCEVELYFSGERELKRRKHYLLRRKRSYGLQFFANLW